MSTPGTPGAGSVADLRDAVRTRRASAVELTEDCLARIAARDAAVHGFATVLADAARAEARAEMTMRIGEREIGAVEAIARLTSPWNLTGLPALSLPCGVTTAGLPIGLQLIGRPFAEVDVLAAGHGFQRVTDWHTRAPRG